ncbi:type II toxin-antitoxin system CcdA family antitoxin [Xylophilus sp.]|uniref:type II toxin-antitoxin system CcdA family antitoxin n=1 Tax=Xylophilus sp. TaxID=2653893 RepID=UPI0013BD02B5|nr:type II toxin-antitoxin system CcdA family antitoxin [Xylophilus sp.]KAF1044710.1 MAG: hypothetical protein GAK38_03428 [Xylophilus sp.]
MPRFDNAPKKSTNLSLNGKVQETARELRMNVSQKVETCTPPPNGKPARSDRRSDRCSIP